MDTKRLDHVELKATGDKGEFSAVIATYGVIDGDGDVTLPGAHKQGQRVVVSPYGHASMGAALPVGAGSLHIEANRTVAKGQFFMDIPEARSAFLTMKRLHEQGLGDWSYGYEASDSEMGEQDGQRVRFLKSQDVFEVSPVLRGAGVDTRTLAAKNASQATASKEHAVHDEPVEFKAAIRPHASPTTNRPWDAASVVAGIAEDASVSDLRSVFAWVDSSSDPEAKTNYRFPHHHGVDGPANIRALVAGIAALNGARGGTNIPPTDRKAVYNHLAAHLRDADREPPELRSAAGGELKLHEEAISVLGGIEDYLAAAERVVALRAQKGKNLSQVNLEALDWVGEGLRRLLGEHGALMRRLADTPREAAAAEYVRFLASQHRAAS